MESDSQNVAKKQHGAQAAWRGSDSNWFVTPTERSFLVILGNEMHGRQDLTSNQHDIQTIHSSRGLLIVVQKQVVIPVGNVMAHDVSHMTVLEEDILPAAAVMGAGDG